MASLLSIWQKSESFSFQSPTMVEVEIFCFEKYALPKKVTSDTSNTVLAILSKKSYHLSDILSVNSEKKIWLTYTVFRKQTCLSWLKSSRHVKHSFGNRVEILFCDLKICLSKSEKKWQDYVLFQREKLRLWRSNRQKYFRVDKSQSFFKKARVNFVWNSKFLKIVRFFRNKRGFLRTLFWKHRMQFWQHFGKFFF